MRLSERGAIRRAIAGGGFHLYPAGRLLDLIKAGLQGDELRSDFSRELTPEKVLRAKEPEGVHAREIFKDDIELLAGRLREMDGEYDIERAFDKMMEAAPAMARRYYGIEGFEAQRPKVVEYYFEGMNDLYKDGDWFAFNVNSVESKEMGVPVGTYFKRDQVTPGHPEFVSLHEANHAMQEKAYLPADVQHYVPWLDEGLADAMARMMLVRATADWKLMGLLKRLRTEVEVTDPRKATYHFAEETAALMLIRGRLPFVKAFMSARKREPHSIDYGSMGRAIRDGVDPHIAAIQAYRGNLEKSFQKKLERDETRFRKEADLDGNDLRALMMFLATERPSCLTPSEYKAALWISDAAKGAGAEGTVPQEAVPEGFMDGISELAAKYFVVKKEIDGKVVYDPGGGGLPHRLGIGEIRCSY